MLHDMFLKTWQALQHLGTMRARPAAAHDVIVVGMQHFVSTQHVERGEHLSAEDALDDVQLAVVRADVLVILAGR